MDSKSLSAEYSAFCGQLIEIEHGKRNAHWHFRKLSVLVQPDQPYADLVNTRQSGELYKVTYELVNTLGYYK